MRGKMSPGFSFVFSTSTSIRNELVDNVIVYSKRKALSHIFLVSAVSSKHNITYEIRQGLNIYCTLSYILYGSTLTRKCIIVDTNLCITTNLIHYWSRWNFPIFWYSCKTMLCTKLPRTELRKTYRNSASNCFCAV